MTAHALITGATGGLGLETAHGLARAGLAVIVTGRTQQAAHAVADSLGPHHLGVGLDVTSESQAKLLVKQLATAGVVVSVLVHNAGVLLHEQSLDAARLTVETNLFGPIRITQALRPVMAADARIVLVSSAMSALTGTPPALRRRIESTRTTREVVALANDYLTSFDHAGLPDAYSMSKALLNALAVAWSLEFRGQVTVAVSPGWIRTRMGGASAPHSVRRGASRIVSACISPLRSGYFYGDLSAVP